MNNKFKDHYKTLQIGQSSTQKEIKLAYYKLIKIWHPDKNPGNKHALETSKMIIIAYAVLSDPKLRRSYDNTYINEQNKQPGQQSGKSHPQADEKFRQQKKPNANYNREQSNRQGKPGPTKDEKSNGRKHGNEKSKANYDRSYEKNNHNQDSNRNKQRKRREYQDDRNRNNFGHHQENGGNQNWNSYQNGSQYQNTQQDDRNRNNYGYQQENWGNANWNSYQKPDQDYTDLYETLGLTKDAKTKDIEKAFRELAAKYGSSENPQVKRQFQKILGAYLVLADPVLRANYDRQNNNNSNSENKSSFSFRFLNHEHFKNAFNWENVLCIFIGCGGVLFIVLKYSGIIILNVGKIILQILPPLLFFLGKLICVIVPPLVKGLVYLATGLSKCIFWSLKMLWKCIF